MTNPTQRTLFDKLWDAHIVRAESDSTPAVLYADLHLVHEVTSAQAFTELRERGLRVQLNLVLGGPRDTPETIRRSVAFFLSLRPDHHCVTLLQPVPGSPMYAELEAAGRLNVPQRWDDYYTNPFYTLAEGHADWVTPPRLDRMIALSPDVVAELKRAYATLGRRMLAVRVKAAARNLVTGRAFTAPGGISRLLRDAGRAARLALRPSAR